MSRSLTNLGCALAVATVAFAIGCGRPVPVVKTEYGIRGGDGSTSVNGTSILARMFENAGHRVVRRGVGSGKIEDCKVIVWAPDSFQPPTMDERREVHDWLSQGHGRTFIFVGRDYDASVDYWQHAANQATSDTTVNASDIAEYNRRLAVVRSVFETSRLDMPDEENIEWFVLQRDHPQRKVESLAGPWSNGIDVQKCDLSIRSRLNPPSDKEKQEAADTLQDARDELATATEWEVDVDDHFPSYDPNELHHEVLLAAPPSETDGNDPFGAEDGFQVEDGIPLVTRVTHPDWSDGAIVVVNNGSFLLNLPLVNHEHRKLAGQLIDECGYEPDRVAFWDRVTFSPADATAAQQDQWEILRQWPTNIILLHLGLLGIVYVMWRFPIFGPSKDLPAPATSDFAHHISALGDLMASTSEVAYARAKLQAYRVNVRGDARDSDVGPITQPPKLDVAAMEFQSSDAMTEYRRGDFHEALRLVNRMIDAQPRRSILWQFKGECLFQLQRFDEAINSFQQLQQVGGPQAAEAFLWISLSHHNAGRTNEAKNVLQEFLDNSDEADPELVSKAKIAMGKLDDATKRRR